MQTQGNNEGKVSLKLDQLTIENGIEHAAAHDALSDGFIILVCIEGLTT
jgi:exodeoxyribonuclease-1